MGAIFSRVGRVQGLALTTADRASRLLLNTFSISRCKWKASLTGVVAARQVTCDFWATIHLGEFCWKKTAIPVKGCISIIQLLASRTSCTRSRRPRWWLPNHLSGFGRSCRAFPMNTTPEVTRSPSPGPRRGLSLARSMSESLRRGVGRPAAHGGPPGSPQRAGRSPRPAIGSPRWGGAAASLRKGPARAAPPSRDRRSPAKQHGRGGGVSVAPRSRYRRRFAILRSPPGPASRPAAKLRVLPAPPPPPILPGVLRGGGGSVLRGLAEGPGWVGGAAGRRLPRAGCGGPGPAGRQAVWLKRKQVLRGAARELWRVPRVPCPPGRLGSASPRAVGYPWSCVRGGKSCLKVAVDYLA